MRRWMLVVAAVMVAILLALVAVSHSRSEATVRDSGRSPAKLTAHSAATMHFEYVIAGGAVYVYSIDHRNRRVQTISLPQIGSSIHGVVASPRTRKLYRVR